MYSRGARIGLLRLALETAAAHCKPGGVLLVMPDVVKETFVSLTTHGGHDSKSGDARAIRYIEWTFDPDPSDTTYTVDFAYLLREQGKQVHVVHRNARRYPDQLSTCRRQGCPLMGFGRRLLAHQHDRAAMHRNRKQHRQCTDGKDPVCSRNTAENRDQR